MFSRFTHEARTAVVYARQECRALGRPAVDSSHLVLGLLRQPSSEFGAHALLSVSGVTLEGARRQSLVLGGPPVGRRGDGPEPFAEDAQQALEQAVRVASRVGEPPVETVHVLVGLLYAVESPALRVLGALNVDLAWLTRQAEDAAITAPMQEGPPTIGLSLAALSTASAAPAAPAWRSGQACDEPPAPGGRRRALPPGERLGFTVAALHRFGRHADGCEAPVRCTCGLDAVLHEVDGFAQES